MRAVCLYRKFPAGGCKSPVRKLDYPALAAAVVREYLTDYDPDFLTEATRNTYGEAFGGKAGYLAPVEGDTYALGAVARSYLCL